MMFSETTMNELSLAWSDFVEGLNGCPITTSDVMDFCAENAATYEEYNAMYELLENQIEVRLDEEDDCSWVTEPDPTMPCYNGYAC